MCYVNFFTILMVLFVIPGLAQEPEKDPLEESYIIKRGGGDEIISHDQYENNINIWKHFNAMEYAPWDTLLKVLSYNLNPGAEGIKDIAVADFDNDNIQEIVAAWPSGSQIEIAMLKADPALLSIDSLAVWQREKRLTISNPPVFSGQSLWFMPPVVFVSTGNFDSDSLPELAIAYLADNGQGKAYVQISAYDVSDSLELTLMGSIMDQELLSPPAMDLCEDQTHLFDIECADFNGDRQDEILLIGRTQNSGPVNMGFHLFATIYAYNLAGENLINKTNNGRELIYSQSDTLIDIANINVAAGNIYDPDIAWGIIGFYEYNPRARDTQTDDTLSYSLITFSWDEDNSRIDPIAKTVQLQESIPTDCYYTRISTLTCQDLNADGLDEIISAFSLGANSYIEAQTFRIYQQSGVSPALLTWADLDDIAPQYFANICIGNIKADTSESKIQNEILIPNSEAGGRPYQFENSLFRIEMDNYGNYQGVTKLENLPYMTIGHSEPVIAGDFDADIRLGKPKISRITQILQPLVILNAPPIHFDVFGEDLFDVCLTYNENDGQFFSHYEKYSSQTQEVETEFTQDWGLSTTLTAGGSYWGVSVSSYLTTTYGKQFSQSGASSTTVSVSVGVDAKEDDRIYATVMDYNLWEYPVYGNFKKRGYVLVVEPLVMENRWFPSKSWSGYAYIPNHEVGNILSYRNYPLLSNNPEVAEKIKGDYNDSFVLDATSSYDWALSFVDFDESGASTSSSYSREWGGSVDFWGSGFSISGSYSREEIYTHRTSVATGLDMSMHLDAIDLGLGEVGYSVTPYSYWSTSGALVMDYAVSPEIAAPGGTPTWWQSYYSEEPDPAFILPWRYDPEKGYTLEEDAKRYQTKDLLFLPNDPHEGQIITIRTRIHNFSLIATPQPVGVRFYIGDPDEGGTLIVGEGNISEVFTSTAISARGMKQVELQWRVPVGIGTFPRIYALIDAAKTLPEIHENNNKSWAILQKSTTTTLPEEDNGMLPATYTLAQNYPNPFNPRTTIEFNLPKRERVRLNVYNVLGEHIVTVEDRIFQAGKHAWEFDARNLPSGLYFYRIQSGKFMQVKKMILLK